MNKLYYCKECKRVVKNDSSCEYCNSDGIEELVVGAPVNVIGSKLKGKILKIMDGSAKLLIKTDSNDKYIRDYEAEKIRKVL